MADLCSLFPALRPLLGHAHLHPRSDAIPQPPCLFSQSPLPWHIWYPRLGCCQMQLLCPSIRPAPIQRIPREMVRRRTRLWAGYNTHVYGRGDVIGAVGCARRWVLQAKRANWQRWGKKFAACEGERRRAGVRGAGKYCKEEGDPDHKCGTGLFDAQGAICVPDLVGLPQPILSLFKQTGST